MCELLRAGHGCGAVSAGDEGEEDDGGFRLQVMRIGAWLDCCREMTSLLYNRKACSRMELIHAALEGRQSRMVREVKLLLYNELVTRASFKRQSPNYYCV